MLDEPNETSCGNCSLQIPEANSVFKPGFIMKSRFGRVPIHNGRTTVMLDISS
jgi:hypothetical protein